MAVFYRTSGVNSYLSVVQFRHFSVPTPVITSLVSGLKLRILRLLKIPFCKKEEKEKCVFQIFKLWQNSKTY